VLIGTDCSFTILFYILLILTTSITRLVHKQTKTKKWKEKCKVYTEYAVVLKMAVLVTTIFPLFPPRPFQYCKYHSVQCYDVNVTDVLCETVTYHIY
jgi:hypothetical protein